MAELHMVCQLVVDQVASIKNHSQEPINVEVESDRRLHYMESFEYDLGAFGVRNDAFCYVWLFLDCAG